MGLTPQQQEAVDAVCKEGPQLVKIKAVAGSGKTHTLIEIAKTLDPTSGLYLAYNRAISEEAAQKFKGTKIKCSTIHSLAYGSVVRQYGLKVGFFGVRNVQPATESYPVRKKVVDLLEVFFLSEYTDIVQFFTDKGTPTHIQDVCIENLNLMTTGKISCSHSFYLKLFHIYMATGEIETPEVDLLLVDEAGDITPLTLDIFRLIKAPKKVAVGDPMQNIYSFNNTINAFTELQGEGVEIELTESFRVSHLIASRVGEFVCKHLDSDFHFTGRIYHPQAVADTKAYIARNNSGLLEEMLRLKHEDIPFHTTRRIDTILELPIILANLGSGNPIEGYQYKHLEKLRSDWEKTPMLQTVHSTVGKYVLASSKDDDDIMRAFNVVMRYGPGELNRLVKYAKDCAKKECSLTLTTAHSSKGLEFGEVEIAPDLNEKVADSLYKITFEYKHYNAVTSDAKIAELKEELRLGYVAATRAMITLTNATFLPQGIIS